MITYQFKLKAKKSDITKFKQQLSAHRDLYNSCLELRVTKYKKEKKNISCFDLIKSEVPKFKGLSNYSSLQQTVRRLDKSYKHFFRKNNSFPRFKNESSFKTIEYAKLGDGCQIKNGSIYIQGIGLIECIFHREIPKDVKIKTISVSFKDGLYVNIICEKNHGCRPQRKNSVGIDFGIQNTVSTSDGKKYSSPSFTKNKLKNIARLGRRATKKDKKAKKALTKIYTKIKNQRKDFNHKLSRDIVNCYDIICLENIKVESIKTKIKNINRRLYDIGISQLMTFISYKAESAGKKVVLVDPAYTTQICSECGKRTKKEIKDRIHSCGCGFSICRDQNAALNILRLGLESLGNP